MVSKQQAVLNNKSSMDREAQMAWKRLFTPIFPLPSPRQHPSYGDCLEVKREYYENTAVLDCVTQCSQSAAHLCEQEGVQFLIDDFLYSAEKIAE